MAHTLDLFEKVEDSLHAELIQRTDPRYRAPVEGELLKQLAAAMKNQSDEQLRTTRLALARLCIR